MQISVHFQTATPPDALVIPFRLDEKLAANLADVARLVGCSPELLQSDFKAEAKEILPLFPTIENAPKRVFLLGLGKNVGLGDCLAAARFFCFKMKSKLPAQVVVELRQFSENENELVQITDGLSNGFELGLYQISLYKTDEKKPHPFGSDDSKLEFFVAENQRAAVEKAVHRGQHFGQTSRSLFDILNAPGNKKLPVNLAAWAENSARENGFSARILLKEDCEKEGLLALLSVNAGSPNSPAFIILEWKPDSISDFGFQISDSNEHQLETRNPKSEIPKIGLVGKGVTFDTGGISIKPSENMHLMKSDMGGAAAVFGAVEMAAKLKLPVHVIGIVPATENMVDGKATKPGDVVGSYSGKTIEVIDTDAEGRIILADGLHYMVKNFQPDVMIDLATLTGSIVRTLGSNAAGLFSQNDSLCEKLIRAADRTGERLWRLPMWESFADSIKSDVADVKNWSGKPVSDAINAAKFLEVFTENHPAWAHLDIAGMAFTASDFSSDRSATGFGVRLLVEFIEDFVD